MDYLHQNNVIHCDLAARNVFVSHNGTCKVGDLGMARFDGSPRCVIDGRFHVEF